MRINEDLCLAEERYEQFGVRYLLVCLSVHLTAKKACVQCMLLSKQLGDQRL